ncbi:fumarylacetoacetate hydrolase family protein [Streptosporangium sp. G11]|uniref:fumarylacetoacetate hydrolase family protein n=1 Tax=Streptosporangium sp. G11 TaxID=3436926 RepID=UPI003EB8048F
MSVNVLRTQDAWWVENDGEATRVPTSATTTAELLADRPALEKARHGSERVPVSGLRPLSPVTAPCRVVAQMVNYRSHARDSGMDPDKVPPTFFRKSSGSVSGPYDPIEVPSHVGLLDYEVEIGLVLGAPLPIGATVTESDLPRLVAGLVVANDVSARDVQLSKGQFYESKSYPTFTPLGPHLTLLDPEDFARLPDLRLTLAVNGQTRQDSTWDDMIVKPARALTLLARFQTLLPGDLLLTGTPGGTALKAPPPLVEKIGALLPPEVKWRTFFARQARNPRYLRPGDRISARVLSGDGRLDLGTQTTTVRAARP